ncbi:phytoene synthase [Kibdelosporangium phytohabitans]|uniref:Phytoene synthase n=1 Tax=Kibdelosporangium phytohabitans TaxID=860235 RepID=A0A0N9I4D0_9PSEU|nr:phytoene synthase [Kibdelosporangium phytohabitans]
MQEGHEMVRAYSTTWYEPVMSMPAGLNEAITSAYLCMRAIDEIEDHPGLDGETKAGLLESASRTFQTRFAPADFTAALAGHEDVLPEVTQRVGEWAVLAPPAVAPRVWETFAAMAERMADWARTGFTVTTKRDLDRYTYAVSGTLVLMLSDLWAWHDGTVTNRTHGIAYGRALQAINILLDHAEDTERDVDFWPDGWDAAQMTRYARAELPLADSYLAALPEGGPAHAFCSPALARYHAALDEAAWVPMPSTNREGDV